MKPQKKFMEAAIKEAMNGEKDDYPIGCVIVRDGIIIAKGKDSLRSTKNPLLHAEMIAVREATKKLGTPYLTDCIAYTTMEPCPMCAGASIWARLKGIVFGARLEDLVDHAQKHGHEERTFRSINMTCKEVLERGDPKVSLVEGFMREECVALFHRVK